MKYNQRHAAARATFAFGETELNYSFSYGASHHDVVVDYFQIATGRKHVAQRDWARLGVSVLLGLAALMAIVVQARYFDATASAWSAVWFLPALLALTLFAFRQAHFVEIQTAGSPVWIIEDASTQSIIAELDRRRRDRLADLYAPLNSANESYLEIRKIEWLVEQAVLTPDQAKDQVAALHAATAEKAEADAEAAAAFDGMFAREALAI